MTPLARTGLALGKVSPCKNMCINTSQKTKNMLAFK